MKDINKQYCGRNSWDFHFIFSQFSLNIQDGLPTSYNETLANHKSPDCGELGYHGKEPTVLLRHPPTAVKSATAHGFGSQPSQPNTATPRNSPEIENRTCPLVSPLNWDAQDEKCIHTHLLYISSYKVIKIGEHKTGIRNRIEHTI